MNNYLIAYAFSIFILGFLRILYFQFEKELGIAKVEKERKSVRGGYTSSFDDTESQVEMSVFMNHNSGFFTHMRLDVWNEGSTMMSCVGISFWPLTGVFFLLLLSAKFIHHSILYGFRWFIQWVIKRGNFVEE